jgi:hypothetical protein
MSYGQEYFECCPQVFALGLTQFFGVRKSRECLPIVPEHGGSYDWAGEASSAGLVHPR